MKIKSLTLALSLATLTDYGQGFIYDQQSSTTNGAGIYGADLSTGQPLGQSLIPTLPSVDFVQFEFTDSQPGNGLGATVYVNLLANSITGTVIGSTAPVTIPDGVHAAVTTFLFSTPAAVTPGTMYYLQAVQSAGDNPWAIVADFFNYPGGTFYFNGQSNPNLDLWFREGIVPEPSTWALVLTGAGLLWLRRRR